MTQSFVKPMDPFVIPAGSDVSQWMEASHTFGDCALLTFYGADDAQSQTFGLQLSWDGVTAYDLQEGNPLADLALPGEDKCATFVTPVGGRFMRVKSSGAAVTDPITIPWSGHFTT